jgi:hypothetical protein
MGRVDAGENNVFKTVKFIHFLRFRQAIIIKSSKEK